MEKQRQHRNNEIRTHRTVVGELTVKDDKLVKGGAYEVCTIPSGVVITKVVGMSVGAGNADFNVKAGTLFDVQLKPKEVKAATDVTMKDKVTPQATPVTLTLNDLPTFGRVLVGIEYLDFDTVTGDRVDAVEA